MNQQIFQHMTAVPKSDITADLFRTNYPDVSLQPVDKNSSNETTKTSNIQHYQVVNSAATEEEEEEVEAEEEENDGGDNLQYVQSQQVTTLPLIYQTQQTTVVQKTMHLGLPVQTTHQIPQQFRLEQNGVIIQPQQLVYATRYTTSNGQLILQPENQPTHSVQTVVVSNAVAEPPASTKQFITHMEEAEVNGQQTINCSIQCVNTPKKPQRNTPTSVWTQQQSSREKAKNTTVIPSSSAAAVVATAVTKARRSPQKIQPNEVKKRICNAKEKPRNVVLPMYPTTKGHVVKAITKCQQPQTTVSPTTTNIPHNIQQQVLQQQQQQIQQPSIQPPPVPLPVPPPVPPALLHNDMFRNNDSTQILIIMPDKSKRIFTLNQQNKDYKIQDLVSELGVSPNDITINLSLNHNNEEDLDEENQREESVMFPNETEEALNHLEPPEDQDEEFSEEMLESTDGDEHLKEHLDEQPEYRNGLLAVCNFCGYSSVDFNRCQRCNRKFPPNVRSVPVSSVLKPIGNSSQKCSRKTKCDDSSLGSENPRKKGKGSSKRKRFEEPVCLTISDDEEGDGDLSQDSSKLVKSRVEPVFVTDPAANLSASQKEPVITEDTSNEEGASAPEAAAETFPEEEVEDECTRLRCRTVRIGSYKVVPHEKVLLSPLGIKIHVPTLDSIPVTLTVLFHEIIKVLISFHKSLPVLFFYTNSTAANRIREMLKMVDKNHLYYDPTSTVEAHKRITLLPEVLDEDNRLFIKHLFRNTQSGKQLLTELDSKEANDILVRASPKDVQDTLNKRNSHIATSLPPTPTFNGGIHTIMVYPPPPTKGGIPINTEDYACLGEDQFLNDVIIDFYLKYLVLTQLGEVDQARTHVFSSFFYKRLTTRPPKATRRSYHPIEDDPNITPAVKRHSRVKSWTKAVDLFSKDYIIIPINEHCHWYLAIICFPGLKGPVRISDNTPINLPDTKNKKDGALDGDMTDVTDVTDVTAKVFSGKKPITIGSTTITAVVNTQPINPTVTLDAGGAEEEDRDEADGDDEDMESNHSSDNESENSIKSKTSNVDEEKEPAITAQEEKKTKKVKREREPIKQPCILIFDSLAGGSRARVVATLRDYLRIEYKVKHKGEERDFSKDVMKGACPKVPQQTNFTDCGLYLLQYVEAFFEMPIKDYHIPIKELLNWFTADIVSRKRYDIQQLLHLLMEQQKIDIESLNLPNLRLRSQKGQLVDYSCSEEEEDDEEEEMEEEEDHMEGELGEPGEICDSELGEEEELCEEEIGDEEMCEEGMCVEGMGEEGMTEEGMTEEMCEEEMGEEMCEEEEEYMGEEDEELCEDELCDDEELDDGEIHPDDIPESVKREFDLKSIRIQRVIPIKQDTISPCKKHCAEDK